MMQKLQSLAAHETKIHTSYLHVSMALPPLKKEVRKVKKKIVKEKICGWV